MKTRIWLLLLFVALLAKAPEAARGITVTLDLRSAAGVLHLQIQGPEECER